MPTGLQCWTNPADVLGSCGSLVPSEARAGGRRLRQARRICSFHFKLASELGPSPRASDLSLLSGSGPHDTARAATVCQHGVRRESPSFPAGLESHLLGPSVSRASLEWPCAGPFPSGVRGKPRPDGGRALSLDASPPALTPDPPLTERE